MRSFHVLLRWLDRFYYIPLILAAFGTLYLGCFYPGMSGFYPNWVGFKQIILSGFDLNVIKSNPNATFPMWGYGWLVLLTEDNLLLGLIQTLLAIAAVMYFIRGLETLRHNVLSRGTIFAIKYAIVAAVSWHYFNTTPWPQSIAASAFLVAIMMLAQAFDNGEFNARLLLGSGLFLGLGLNFRSDYLLYAVGAMGLVFYAQGFRRKVAVQITVWCLTIMSTMVPWMVYTHRATGHVLLSSTNGGAALIGGLGNLPDNKWGLAMDDAACMRVLREGLGAGVWFVSYEGDRYLKRKFWELVVEDPGEYLRKVRYVLHKQATRECAAADLQFHPLARANAFSEIVFPRDYLLHPHAIFQRHGFNALIVFGCHFSQRYNHQLFPKSFWLLLVTLPIALFRRNLILLLIIEGIIYQLLIQCLIGHVSIRTLNAYLYHIVNMIAGIGFLASGLYLAWERRRQALSENAEGRMA